MSAVGTIISVISDALPEAIGLIGDILGAGKNPKIEIRRIRQTKPFLAEVDRAWEDALDDKYGPDTDPGDPYADELDDV